MAMENTTTNERSKRSDLKYYYEKKIEFLEDWINSFKNNAAFEIKPREKEMYQIDPKWGKSQVENQLKMCQNKYKELHVNFYK